MSFQKIKNILDDSNVNFAVLLCHHNADPDALCSAYALKRLLKHYNPHLKLQIGAAQGISSLSTHLSKQLSIKIKPLPEIESSDVIILLDTNTIQQLDDLAEEVKSSKAPLIVIDHHAPHPKTEKMATLYITNDEFSSTCEIIHTFYKELDINPNKNEAKALFLGIAFDTRHFLIAGSSTFKAIAELVEAGVNPQETLSLLSLPMPYSERIARLKASKRTELHKVNEWITVTSHVGAYQASSARALISLGAHVAVIAGQKEKKVTISLRSTRKFHKETGVHLGRDIAKPLGEHLHGTGGGHPTAAGVNGMGDIKTGLKRCLRILKEKLPNN